MILIAHQLGHKATPAGQGAPGITFYNAQRYIYKPPHSRTLRGRGGSFFRRLQWTPKLPLPSPL